MKDGTILRISHGIYYYPKIDKVLGLGILYPTLEEIAEGIAKHDKVRIVPTGLYALNRLGFSTQIPMNVVYLTDGFNRKITLYNGSSIQFKRIANDPMDKGPHIVNIVFGVLGCNPFFIVGAILSIILICQQEDKEEVQAEPKEEKPAEEKEAE